MKKVYFRIYLVVILFISGLYTTLSAQQVKGRITDSTNTPVSFATLYIRETAQGIVADEQGEFQSTLPAGKYTFEFSSLGYEKKIISIEVKELTQEVTVVLKSKIYSLQEIQISSRQKEDPAYGIMRKAISMAPYYLNQVKEYESEVYIKGTMKMDKIPRYAKVMAKEENLGQYENKLFLLESQNRVHFTAPDTYEKHVIAVSSSIPADIEVEEALDLITTSIYNPNAFGRISPLAPGAFTYYKFKLEGVSMEGNHLINKIRVTPKKKNPKLVTGWLYIIENTWNVKSAGLSATEMGITISFTGTYNEVRPNTFLPTAYDIDLNISIAGVKASGKYYSSIQYNSIDINEAIPGSIQQKTPPAVISGKPKTKKQEKAEKQLETLSAKDNISTREAYKMAKLMEEVVEPEEIRQQKESLEIISGSTIKVTVDSLALARDSAYWEKIRSIPLRNDEIVSYQEKDSLKQARDSNRPVSRGEQYGRSGSAGLDNILLGGSIRLKKNDWLSYSGLLNAVPEYNFVDGFWLGQKLTWKHSFKHSRSFSLSPSVYYVTARKSVNWQVEGNLFYNKIKNGSLYIKSGNTTADFNSQDGHLRILNSLSSLFFATTPIKFYKKEFIEVRHRIDLTNGLFFTSSFTHEKRSNLENRTKYSFFGGNPDSNNPDPDRFSIMPEHTSTTLSVEFEYTPRYKYHLWGGEKQYASSRYPTFSLFYEAGIPAGTKSLSSFNRLEAGIKQEIKLNAFDRIQYFANAGIFLSYDRIMLPDYKHFTTSQIVLTEKSLYTGFTLVDSYRYSTNDKWAQGHVSYTSKYLLFKRLPFLQNMIFDEGIHAKTLWQPGWNYSELGYSIGFENVIRVGFFTGFLEGSYDSFGIRLSIPVMLEF